MTTPEAATPLAHTVRGVDHAAFPTFDPRATMLVVEPATGSPEPGEAGSA